MESTRKTAAPATTDVTPQHLQNPMSATLNCSPDLLSCTGTTQPLATAITDTTRSWRTTSGSTTVQPSSSSRSGRRVGTRRPRPTRTTLSARVLSSTHTHAGSSGPAPPPRNSGTATAHLRPAARSGPPAPAAGRRRRARPGCRRRGRRRPGLHRRADGEAQDPPAVRRERDRRPHHEPDAVLRGGDLRQVQAAGGDRGRSQREHQRDS